MTLFALFFLAKKERFLRSLCTFFTWFWAVFWLWGKGLKVFPGQRLYFERCHDLVQRVAKTLEKDTKKTPFLNRCCSILRIDWSSVIYSFLFSTQHRYGKLPFNRIGACCSLQCEDKSITWWGSTHLYPPKKNRLASDMIKTILFKHLQKTMYDRKSYFNYSVYYSCFTSYRILQAITWYMVHM